MMELILGVLFFIFFICWNICWWNVLKGLLGEPGAILVFIMWYCFIASVAVLPYVDDSARGSVDRFQQSHKPKVLVDNHHRQMIMKESQRITSGYGFTGEIIKVDKGI